MKASGGQPLAKTPLKGDAPAMQDAATIELETLLNRFVEGIDTSLAAANRLEVLLADMYPDDDVVADRVGDLAQYRPGGGDYLLGTAEMQSRLARLSTYIASLKI